MPSRIVRAVAGAPLLCVLGACSPAELAPLQTQLNTWSGSGSATATNRTGRIPYNQGSSVTPEQVARLRHYAKNQPTSGMRKLLGTPAWIDDNGETEVYPIAGERGPVVSGNRLIVRYRASPNCNYQCYEAYDWRQQ